jgi:hypothetical protein
MEKVVYLLGAGFSAPLGLPVMGDFLMKSKDMYATNRTSYKHFEEVFQTIRDMSISKNYYEADLFNIEEILSILEMENRLEGKKLHGSFIRYLADVITHYTPDMTPHEGSFPANWHEFLFSKVPVDTWSDYGFFIATILNLSFKEIMKRSAGGGNTREVQCHYPTNREIRYSIITLNYDMIPEKICQFINEKYDPDHRIRFKSKIEEGADENLPTLAKLHGSIEERNIVAPTWSKDVNEKILDAWKLAHKSLTEANHLRILGYSLPETDAYVRYLLKSAVIKSDNLKTIDVICFDDYGTVQKRYDDFISFKNYRFIQKSIESYLTENRRSQFKDSGEMKIDRLEHTHKDYFR